MKPPPDWLVWLLFWWALIPMFAILFVALVVPAWLRYQKCRYLGPYCDRWQDWFAWRPVRINKAFDADEGRWVWLERIERRLPRYSSWPTEYRTDAQP